LKKEYSVQNIILSEKKSPKIELKKSAKIATIA
jgi:hypothetical protein